MGTEIFERKRPFRGKLFDLEALFQSSKDLVFSERSVNRIGDEAFERKTYLELYFLLIKIDSKPFPT
jgi:hypothetical protein